MQERHINRSLYFDEQVKTTTKYVVPYIEQVMAITEQTRILEVGCGEGGNMVPFLQKGAYGLGIDLHTTKIANGVKIMQEQYPTAKVDFICQDIYTVELADTGQFDLIILRDVIEHLHNQERFMTYVKKFLRPNGKIFFGFPPWRMPFGGHQQVSNTKLSKVPFIHLLPSGLYAKVLRWFGENETTIAALLEIKDTGISIGRFESIVQKEQYQYDAKTLYFINPNYEIKFGLTPRRVWAPFTWIPFFKDFYTTCYYCIISQNK